MPTGHCPLSAHTLPHALHIIPSRPADAARTHPREWRDTGMLTVRATQRPSSVTSPLQSAV